MRPSPAAAAGAAALRNILGAFSDGAVLFPLLALLSVNVGFSGPMVFLSTGLAYLASAVVFRVPMSVQPLKSIAIAAITVGATFQEVRLSGLLLGLFCLAVCIFDVDRLARRIPGAVIHQLQLGLGLLLILQGLKVGGDWNLVVLGISAVMVLLPDVRGVPLLGLVATAGVVMAFWMKKNPGLLGAAIQAPELIRPRLVLTLLLPQLVLTLSNSVIATQDVCNRYFGESAWRVSVRRLLYSIGLGNVVVACVGGMPFCHGSGGVTAHVRGGSTRAWSTALMGVFLLALALFQFVKHDPALNYPPILVAALLVATGMFHLKLAGPTAASILGWAKLSAALVITFFTRNLLWVLGGAVLFEMVSARWIAPAPVEMKS